MLTHVAEIEDLYEGWMDAGKSKKEHVFDNKSTHRMGTLTCYLQF